jgi:hypothetical protein
MKKLILFLTLAGAALSAHADPGTPMTIEKYNASKIHSSRRVISQLTPEFIYTGSTLDSKENDDLDGMRMGIGAGARLDIGRGDFVFETGIMYRQMGGVGYIYSKDEAAEKHLTSQVAAEIELNYISIPLMAKYYFNGRENASFYAHGGLQPSILIYREARPQDTNAPAVLDLSSVSDFDLVASVGMGFHIELNETTMMVFEGNYLRGLTSTMTNMPVYTQGFQGTIGLGILL